MDAVRLFELVAGISVVTLASLWFAREAPLSPARRAFLVAWGVIYVAAAGFAYYALQRAASSLVEAPPADRNRLLATWLNRSSNWLLVSRIVLALGFLTMMAWWARSQRDSGEVTSGD